MGAVHVTVGIRNPAEPDRVWEGLFLVDTRATDCLVPRQHLESIGLNPQGHRVYELADGSEVRLGIAVAQVEFMGEFVGATVVFGDPESEPLLGMTALESVGIVVDPRNQTLKRLPAVRLKGLRGSGESAQRSAVDILDEAPGQRLFKTAADVNAYLKDERASWER